MAKVPLVLFPSRTSFKEVLQGFQAPQGAPQGENTKGTFVKGHLCAYLSLVRIASESGISSDSGQRDAAWIDTMVWYGMVWYSMVWYGMVWYGTVRYGVVWYGMV